MNASKLVSSITDLSAPSPSVVKLMGLLNGSDVESGQVVSLVKCDGVLCGKLLSACNSAAASLSQRIGSIEQAVFHLGYKKVYQQVLSVSFGGTLSGKLPAYSIDDQELWRHSLLTALICESIQNASSPVDLDASVAYTAGLLHDIGKIVLNRYLDPKCVTSIRELLETGGCTRIEAERSVLDTDHAEVGAMLMESWSLPYKIVEAVAHHHAPIVKPSPLSSVVVHVANTLAHELGSAPGWNSYAIRNDENAISALGLNADAVERLMITAHGSLYQVEEMVSAQ